MTTYVDTLDLAGHPPFAPGQSLALNQGLTIVSGPSGSGTSVIAELIRSRVLPVRSPREGTEELALDWTAGPHRDVELPYGGRPWPPLTAVLQALNRTGGDRGGLVECVQSRLGDLLQEKVSSGQSKFYGVVTSSDQIQVALSEDHGVQLMTSSGQNLDALFLAEGERLVLYLAVTAGVRQVLELNAPFVADDPFEWMDHLLRGACFRVASSMAPQVLLLLGPRSVRELSVHADYQLRPVKGSEQIQVIRVS